MWGAKSNLIVGGAVGEGTGTAAAIMKKDRGEEVSLSGGQSEEVGVRSQKSEGDTKGCSRFKFSSECLVLVLLSTQHFSPLTSHFSLSSRCTICRSIQASRFLLGVRNR